MRQRPRRPQSSDCWRRAGGPGGYLALTLLATARHHVRHRPSLRLLVPAVTRVYGHLTRRRRSVASLLWGTARTVLGWCAPIRRTAKPVDWQRHRSEGGSVAMSDAESKEQTVDQFVDENITRAHVSAAARK